MKYKVIKNKKQYKEALARLENLFDAKRNTPEGDQLELLTLLISKYEEDNFKIEYPDPIEAIKFRMEQLGMKQKDLANTIGFDSRVSEILNKKRKLTLDMIRKISYELDIPTSILVKEY